MEDLKFVKVSLANDAHLKAVVGLLNEYMKDEMGIGRSMSGQLAKELMEGLPRHSSYLGFLVQKGNTFVALANCNLNYSTWKAKFVLNIHDFIVHPDHRNEGIGKFLLQELQNYSLANSFCKITLEVREDNLKAQKLYNNIGFKGSDPAMLFWHLDLHEE